jgi:hypothetical protein
MAKNPKINLDPNSMVTKINLHSSFTGDESLILNQDTLWLGHLLLEGLPNKDKSIYKHVSIDARANWGQIEGEFFKSYGGICYYENFNLEMYKSQNGKYEKSIYLLDYIYSKLITYNIGVPFYSWRIAYDFCVQHKFKFTKRWKRKNVKLRKIKGKSCYLYGEIDINKFRVFVVIEDSINNTCQRQLIATPPRYYFDNFDGYKLKVNPDNTIDVWDASYYKDNFKLEGIELDLDI